MGKNTKENETQVYIPNPAKVELVRNPYIAYYLHNNEDVRVDDTVFEIINQDKMYNDEASLANNCYIYSNKIREATSIRYVRASSGVVPESYISGLAENGVNIDDDILIPYDYLLVTRSDNTQFLISENFTSNENPTNMHKYSVIRYVGGKDIFREDNIYSDGIDLSRLLTNDQNYIDVFSNDFLSERRLNETLMTAYSSLDIQKLDETDHGGQYAGYIDSKELNINSSMEKNALLLFEKKIREGGI